MDICSPLFVSYYNVCYFICLANADAVRKLAPTVAVAVIQAKEVEGARQRSVPNIY